MKKNKIWARRVIAMALTLVMVLSSTTGYVSDWFAAFAEENAEISESLVETTVAEPSSSEESKPAAEPARVEESKPAAEPARVEESKHETEPARVEETKPEAEPARVEETKPEAEPVRVWGSEPASEPARVEETKPEAEPVRVWGSEPVEEPTYVEESKPVEEEPTQVEESEPAEEPTQVGESEPEPVSELAEAPSVIESEPVEAAKPVEESEPVDETNPGEIEEQASEPDGEPSAEPVETPAVEAMEESDAEAGAHEPEAINTKEEQNETAISTQSGITAASELLGVSMSPVENRVVLNTAPETSAEPEGDAAAALSEEGNETAEAISLNDEGVSETVTTIEESVLTVEPALNGAEDDGKAGISILQKKINEAMSGTLTGKIRVILERNMIYTGNETSDQDDGQIVVSAGDKTVEDDFELELVAEDAGDDGTEGEGYTTIDAELVIKGVRVVMKSVMMGGSGKITVRDENTGTVNKGKGGTLIYYGTKNVPNKFSVTVGNKSEAELYTTDSGDTVNVTTESGAKSLLVDVGNGANRVNASIGGGAVEIRGGTDKDTVDMIISGKNDGVAVSTGGGPDAVKVVNNGSASSDGEMIIDTGEDDDQITLDARANGGDMTVNTGKGSDTVEVYKGDTRAIDNLDYDSVVNLTEAIKTSGGAKISFVNGDDAAVDRFTVDANAGLAMGELHFEGGKGASIYLKGKLNDQIDKTKRMERVNDGFQIHVTSDQTDTEDIAVSDKTLKFTYSGDNYNFTDALKNKNRVELYPGDKGDFAFTADQEFTDYVIKTNVGKELGSIAARASKPMLLTNLVLDGFEMGDDSPYIPTLDADNVNVLIKGQTININNPIKAQNVRAESAQGSLSFSGAFEAFSEGVPVMDIVANLFSVADDAVVNVNAAITTAHDIALVSRVKHFGGIFSMLPESLNLFNLKMAKAAVTIKKSAELKAGSHVVAEAKINTTAGYTVDVDSSDTNDIKTQTKEGGAVGIEIILNDASVNVENGASIDAGDDVLLAAKSDVRVYNYAFYGGFSSPVALAVTGISNDVTSKVNGKVTAGRKVTLDASGSVVDETEASYKNGVGAAGGGAVGGFLAINVVDQAVNAVIGRGANVTAKTGDVAVYSSKVANVRTTATSGGSQTAEASSPGVESASKLFGVIGGIVWEKFRDSIGYSTQAEKFVKTVKKVSAGTYSVKVVEVSEENEKMGSATVKTKVGTKLDKQGGVATYGLVEPSPKAGYAVKSVRIRYLNPGEDHYTYETVAKNKYGQYLFLLEHEDVEVLVTYTEGKEEPGGNLVDENADNLEDTFQFPDLFEDAVEGVAGNADDDFSDYVIIEGKKIDYDKEYEIIDNVPDEEQKGFIGYWLGIENAGMKGGKILTWNTNVNDRNVTRVQPGQQVRFVPNPEEGQALKTLTIKYKHPMDGNEVEESVIVEADKQGRYIFTVPEGLPEDTDFTVSAEFDQDTTGGAKQPAHKQATGALAVGVTVNEGGSVVESDSDVNAGGELVLFGFKNTASNNFADGTAIVEKDEKAVAKEQNAPKTVQDIKYTVPGRNVGLKVSGTLKGEITSNTELREGNTAVNPEITFQLADPGVDYAKVRAVVSYYTKVNVTTRGRRVSKTIELTKNAEGKYVVDLNTTDYPTVDGSVIEVSYIFEDANGNVLTPEDTTQGTTRYVVPNPINISVNQLKEGDKTTSLGDVYYVRTDKDAKGNPIYYFRLSPEAGYKCQPLTENSAIEGDGTTKKSDKKVLYASWVGEDGIVYKGKLVQDASCHNSEWYFRPVDGNISVPEGALITINAVFSEDRRDVHVNYDSNNAEGSKKGTASLSDTAAKAGDTVYVTLNAKEGWYPSDVVAYVVSTLDPSVQKAVNVKRDEKDPTRFEIIAPAYQEGEYLFVSPRFGQKTVELKTVGDTKVQVSEADGKAAGGQTVTVQPTKEDLEKGMKLDTVTVTYTNTDGTTGTINAGSGSFRVPDNAKAVSIQATLKQKDYSVSAYTKDDNGTTRSIVPEASHYDKGDTVTLNIKAGEGYRAKAGTVKAIVTTKTGGNTGTHQIVADWVKENTYAFKLPLEGQIQDIHLTGEFEPGSDGVELSLGVAVALGVTRGKNNLEIQGTQTEKYEEDDVEKTRTIKGARVKSNGLSMVGVSLGGSATTEAMAGFNSGDTGVAGAFAVQVAKTTTNNVIRSGAELTENGAISIQSKGTQDFGVTADASGKKNSKAKNSGVGAGITFAVDGLETTGFIEDGVVLKDGSTITGVTLNAGHRYKDQNAAKAGATGGSAWVPVAAVDVFNSRVRAELGQLMKKNEENPDAQDEEDAPEALDVLDVSGKVKVEAWAEANRTQYNHEVTADAAARGGNTAMGGAFIVTWLDNDVKALVRQSLKATKDITVNVSSGNALKAVARAAASGGNGGKKDSNGDGSADKQANKMLGGAGNIAGKYGDMDGNAIKSGAKDRQKAETAEQSITGAGAFVLNMQKSKLRSEIEDGVNITTDGKLRVHSANRLEANIRADASATQSDVGVGVGVALNIVTMENIARVGNGTIKASELEVLAEIAKAPTKVRSMTVVEDESQFNSVFKAQLTEALREMLGDEWGWLADVSGSVISKLYDTLIADLNLKPLFSVMDDGVGSAFEEAGKRVWERLKAFPKALAAPILEVYDELYDSVEGLENGTLEKILENAWNTVTVQLYGNGFDLGKKILLKGADGMASGLIDVVTGKITGQGGGGDKLMEAFANTMVEVVKELIEKTIEQAVRDIGAAFPVLNESNVALIQELKKKSFSDFKSGIVPYITATFRDTVWDYTPVVKRIDEDGFTEFLKDELRRLMKEAAVAFTNEMIDKTLSKLNVKIAREAIEDRHIITTQAIAGAGAKEKSGTGSLAIAVANLNTVAEIAGGEGKVEITGYGDLTVKAEEARRIRTVSTAAVDANGEADSNEGVGDSENAQTGGSGASQKSVSSKDGMVTVTNSVGGSVAFGETEDGRLYITPDKGYKLSKKNITRTWTKPDGTEVIDNVTLEKYGDDYLIIPTEGTGTESMDEEQLKNFHISLDIEFEEDLRAIPAVTFSTKGGAQEYVDVFKASGEEITFSVEGKEGSDKVGKAKEGDLVEITIPQVDELDPYLVDVYDGNGKIIARFAMDPLDKVPAGAQTMTKVSSNANETVLGFRMTDVDVGKVELLFSKGYNNWGKKKEVEEREAQAAAEQAKSKPTDRAGRSVGVGAAFTLTYGNSDVKALIGERKAGVSSGTVAVTASSDHEEKNFATAGTDPFEGVNVNQEDSEKDVGVDASVSVNILDNDILASIASGTNMTTAIDPEAENDNAEEDGDVKAGEDEEEDKPEAIKVTRGSVIVDATETAANETKASAFATGSTTAVGASVAVNVSLSDINTQLGGPVDAAGKVVARTHSLSKDDTWSFASALGADLQRNLNKVAKFTKGTSDAANSLTNGTAYDKKAEDEEEKKKSTNTSKKITDRLNNDKVKNKDGSKASENLSVSTNVQRVMGSKFDAGNDAQNESNGASDLVNKHGGQNLGGNDNGSEDAKLQVAATVGVTVALHTAAVRVDGSKIKAGEGVSFTARNAGNFNTRATAASMSLADSHEGSSIAAAVGVSVNNNKASVDVYGDIEAAGDVEVASDLTQNMTDTYRGRLAVQSLSGSVSGKNTDKSIAGAISMVISHADSHAVIHGAESKTLLAKNVQGANVSVTARDKSKLAVRAGGINYSKGAATGAGLSSATVWSGNDVEARLGDAIQVTADTFTLDARKEGVSLHDYKFPLGWQNLISDSSDLDDEERENVRTGLIDVHRKPGEKSYQVDVNMDTYALMQIPDMLNFLGTTNYYAEAIAGSVVGKGSGKDGDNNLAGSVSIVRTDNTVNTAVGKGASIILRNMAEENTLRLNAQNDNNTRLIGGALSAGASKNTIGGIITFLSASDTVKTTLGEGATLEGGDVAQKASSDVSVQTFNAAVAVNTADEASKTVGAAIDALLLNNKVENDVGKKSSITSDNDIDMSAKADMELILVSASLAAAKKATAAGGTVAFVNDKTQAKVNIGDNHRLTAYRNVGIHAAAKDRIISVIASASGATDAQASTMAGSLNVINAATKGLVSIGRGDADSTISATSGDIAIKADADARVINVTAAMAGSGGKATGLSANVNVFQREANVAIAGGEGYGIRADGNVQIAANGEDFTVMTGLAASGSTGSGNALSGNLPIVVGLNTVKNTMEKVNVTARRSAEITSALNDRAYVIAGTVAASNAGNAMGATAMVVVKENTVRTDLGESKVAAGGNSMRLASTGESYTGIYVDAKVRQTLIAGAAGISAGGSKGVTANVVTVVSGNDVRTDASKATLDARDGAWKYDKVYVSYKSAKSSSEVSGMLTMDKLQACIEKLKAGELSYVRYQVGGRTYTLRSYSDLSLENLKYSMHPSSDITVKAENDARETVFAGGVSIGKSMGAGASVVVAVAKNDVKALTHDIEANRNVDVIADNDDKYILLNVNLGASGGNAVELGATVTSLESRANAEVASKVTANKGAFNLKANNRTNITNVAVALAGSKENAVTPVFVYTGFSGEAKANLKAGTVVAGQGVNVSADSGKDVDQYTVGMSASGKVAVSGAVSILKLGDKTSALVGAPVSVSAAKMDVTADSDYKLVGASGTFSGAKDVGVAVNAIATVVKASTLAEMGGQANVQSGGLNVQASSKRDVINAALTVAGGGKGGVSVGVMALIAGDKMDQEAADQLTYGSATNKDTKLFDASGVIENLKSRGIDTSSMEEKKDKDGNVIQTGMTDDLSGNNQYTDTRELGHSEGEGKAKTFDVASGYSDGSDGEKLKASETEDVQRAKKIGSTVYSDSPKDSVIARISESADITGGVNVHATQTTLADLYGASVGVGGSIGGGISLSIAKLRSNVLASSLGVIHANDKDVSVQAISNSGTAEADDDEKARSKALRKSLGDKIDPTKRSIRAVGLAVGGGGIAGGAVAAGFVRLDNLTSATLAGSVEKARNIDVAGKAQYDNVLSTTVAVGGGSTAGVAGSFAVAVADGTVSATMGNNRNAKNAVKNDANFSNSGNTNVTTNSVFGANAIAVSAAGGGYAGVAGGLALATNNLTQTTAVDRGAKLTNTSGTGTLNVKADSTSTANGYLMGLSAGIGSVGVGVSIVKIKPSISTTVGVSGATKGTTALNGYKTVNVKNDTISAGESDLVSAAIGAVSVGVNVMNVYNTTEANAKVANLDGTIDELNVSGVLDAKGVSNVTAVAVGAAGIGITVNYVDVNSVNLAEADLTKGNLTIQKALSVITGDQSRGNQTSADAYSVVGQAGLAVVGVTTAVARNRALNDALITGGTVRAKDVTLSSYSTGTSEAKITGASVGGITIATSVVNALNETTSAARMNLTGALNGNLTARSDVQGRTNARLITGGGSLILGVGTNVATANGNTTSLVDVAIGGSTGNKQKIDTKVTGKDTVKTTIENLVNPSFGLSVATMVGGAHSHDVYNNQVKLANGEYNLSDVNVNTEYSTSVDSDVTPSSGGISLSMIGVSVNKSSGTSDAYAGAMLTLSKAKANIDGDVNVKTAGSSNVYAVVTPAKFDYSTSIGVGSNVTRTESNGTQAATLKLADAEMTKAKAVNVESIVKNADANAIVSASGKDENASNKRVKIAVVAVDANTATAKQNIASTAAILGEKNTKYGNDINAASLKVRAVDDNAITSKARTDGAYKVGLVTGGSMEGNASTGAVYHVVVEKVKAKVTGNVVLTSKANAVADVVGAMPGSIQVSGGVHSDIKAGVGTKSAKQTSKVLIGADTEISADGTFSVYAFNSGDATTSFRQGTSFSLADWASSKQPTDSWYDTGVVIGNGAKLRGGNNTEAVYTVLPGTKTQVLVKSAANGLDILSETKTNSESVMKAKNVGLLINCNLMKGQVTVHSDNNITIGEKADLSAKGNVEIKTADVTKGNAYSDLSGGGLFDGSSARADGTVTRKSIITVGKGTNINAENGGLFIQSRSGQGDDIRVEAYVDAGGLVSLARARAYATVTSNNEVHILEGASLKAKKDLRIYTVAESHGGRSGAGIFAKTKPISKAAGFDPESYTNLKVNFTSYVNINRASSGTGVNLTSTEGNVKVHANNEEMNLFADPGGEGKGGVGSSKTETNLTANLNNLVWVDLANISAKNAIDIRANNGNSTQGFVRADTQAELYGGGGVVRADNYIKGTINSQIRSATPSSVTFKAKTVTHKAEVNLNDDVDYHRKRTWGWGVFSTKQKGDNHWDWKKYSLCDFCKTNAAGVPDIKTSASRSAATDLKAALKKAKSPMTVIQKEVQKILSPLTDIHRQLNSTANVVRAHYGAEDNTAISRKFVLESHVILDRDAALDHEQIEGYRLWNNASIYLDVYTLPNATRLYGNRASDRIMLEYVAEVLNGYIQDNGESHDIDIITALTQRAYAHPVMPVGSTGSLDFKTGVLTLPSLADYELYLHEISGKWLIDSLNDGFFQVLMADADAINDSVRNGKKLPSGNMMSNLIDGGEADGWQLWWIGVSPETTTDPDQTLVFLLINAETDEVDAFRTTARAIENGEEPVDVSLYLFRNSTADRLEKEKYDAVFFDTPEDVKSLVEVVTDVMMGDEIQTPLPMKIVLRGSYTKNLELPVYSLLDHFYAMCDGTDKHEEAFEGFYENTFDGDTFESDYIRIGGIADGDLNVIIKKDQPIWMEWDGEDMAVDIAGQKYIRVDNVWHPETETPTEPMLDGALAA